MIGYGTAALGRSLSVRERSRLVETALDAGIRYFDTAPLYGTGAAEDALGRVLSDRDDLTVATKVGIVPPRTLWRLVGRHPATGGRFEPDDVRRQLEGSLRRLRRERVDLLLLHEVEPEELTPALLETLGALRREGKLERTGIATGPAQTESILASRHGAFPEVVQVAARSVPDPGDAALVVHSVLADRVGSTPAVELLREAARAHPSAVILFGSRRHEHVRQAAKALD